MGYIFFPPNAYIYVHHRKRNRLFKVFPRPSGYTANLRVFH